MLTGTGRAFCSGQDLSDGGTVATLDLERVLREEYMPMLRAITDCPVPTIAAVNGPAAGAGANLALSADVVIAAESAYFLQAFTRIGLIPDAGGTWALPRQMGLAKAMGAALFAEPISAREASDWGMIWECVSDEGFEAHWQARAAHLANGPTQTYRAVKDAIRASWDNSLDRSSTWRQSCRAPAGRAATFRRVWWRFSRNARRGSRAAEPARNTGQTKKRPARAGLLLTRIVSRPRLSASRYPRNRGVSRRGRVGAGGRS